MSSPPHNQTAHNYVLTLIKAAKNLTSHLCHEPIRKNNDAIPVLGVFLGFALFAVVLRVMARVLTKAYFWWDDLCNLFAFITCICFSALNFKPADHGYGVDIWFVAFDDITMVLRVCFLFSSPLFTFGVLIL